MSLFALSSSLDASFDPFLYLSTRLVFLDDTDDVALDEFKDEIEEWVIAELKSIGCDSAKSVIEQSVEELGLRCHPARLCPCGTQRY